MPLRAAVTLWIPKTKGKSIAHIEAGEVFGDLGLASTASSAKVRFNGQYVATAVDARAKVYGVELDYRYIFNFI